MVMNKNVGIRINMLNSTGDQKESERRAIKRQLTEGICYARTGSIRLGPLAVNNTHIGVEMVGLIIAQFLAHTRYEHLDLGT